MLRIAIVGPESSGKTTIAAALAEHFGTRFVEEFARDYLTQRGGIYREGDLLEIALSQDALSRKVEERIDSKVIFHDTDMITIKIWSEEKYARVHEQIEMLVRDVHYDHWFLCRPDIPWESDPLRENPHDRDRLFKVYEHTLRSMQKPFTVLEGSHDKRLRTAIDTVETILREC